MKVVLIKFKFVCTSYNVSKVASFTIFSNFEWKAKVEGNAMNLRNWATLYKLHYRSNLCSFKMLVAQVLLCSMINRIECTKWLGQMRMEYIEIIIYTFLFELNLP